MRPLEDTLSTVMAVLLIAGLECTFFVIVYKSWMAHGLTVSKTALLTVVHVVYGLLICNFIACALSDPGRVPEEYAKRFQLLGDTGEIASAPSADPKDMPRWCHLCAQVKPPRAHHCSTCRRCVLKMDHHCPWMGVCIGHGNHGHFVRFLVYVVLCSLLSVAAASWWLWEEYGDGGYGGGGVEAMAILEVASDYRLYMMVFAVVVCIGVVAFVGALGWYHVRAIANNQTTIEAMEEDRLKRQLTRQQLHLYRFPYRLDHRFDNVKQTMGSAWWLWPFPWPNSLPDGLQWPVHPQSMFGGQWPVRFKELDEVEGGDGGGADGAGAGDGELERVSREYRRRIRKDSEGFTLPQRLFPEFYTATNSVSLSDPHLLAVDNEQGIVTSRRGARSLSPRLD